MLISLFANIKAKGARAIVGVSDKLFSHHPLPEGQQAFNLKAISPEHWLMT